MPPFGLEHSAISSEIHDVQKSGANPRHDSQLQLVIDRWQELSDRARAKIVSIVLTMN